MTEDVTLDARVVESLRELEDPSQPDFLDKLIQLFVDSTPERIALLHRSLDQADRRTVGTVAHTLKSSTANMGAMKLSRICKELEAVSMSQPFGALKAIVADLETEYVKAREELEKYRTEGAHHEDSGG